MKADGGRVSRRRCRRESPISSSIDPMDLRFFFKIGGAQETLASAFLATLLFQDVWFRQCFLEFLADHDGSRQLATLASASWVVSTEQPTEAGPVDIVLRSLDCVCIIAIDN